MSESLYRAQLLRLPSALGTCTKSQNAADVAEDNSDGAPESQDEHVLARQKSSQKGQRQRGHKIAVTLFNMGPGQASEGQYEHLWKYGSGHAWCCGHGWGILLPLQIALNEVRKLATVRVWRVME